MRPYCLLILVLPFITMATAVLAESGKKGSVFFPPELIAKARANCTTDPWAADQKKAVIKAAQPWIGMSDDQLWDLMFGATIKRSWMVWSNGFCPSCKKPVPMYNWKIDALAHPWKARCPHCSEFFPKNDFGKFYASGLDDHGVFDPKKADRSLLFNSEHPDPNDPMHTFGVDDGEGYVEGDKRWRFIGAYLIYGQWKQAVLGGIRNLSAAYVLTGEPKYAHKALVLLDRVADLYPTFDFARQACVYEVMSGSEGYVSVWHDACEETRELVMSYDMVRDAIPGDRKLVEFLSKKAQQFGIENPKASADDVKRNIEDRILRDALAKTQKIHSNYPRMEIAKMVTMCVLGWPENRDQVMAVFDPTLDKATAADGVTGEKGLSGYTAFTIQSVASLLEQFSRLDPAFLKGVLKRHPRIHDMFRFHIDTWCMQEYYPQVGDTGSFGRKCASYVGGVFIKNPSGSMWTFALTPSMYSFLWRMYELTGDTAFVQVLYHSNNNSVDGLPYDLFCDDPAKFRRSVENVIARVGTTIEQESVNKQEWHIAILRSGEGPNARSAWLEYDSFGNHGHANHMTLGLFARGLDLLPDFGYKPVQFGGWGSPRANWYGKSAAHNTVVVDGQDHVGGAGKTTLWIDGKEFHAITSSGPEPAGVKRFERTVALVDVSEKDFYLFDVFRVVGGRDHAKFTGSHFGSIATEGLTLKPAPDYGNGTQMRNFQVDAQPRIPWSVDWKIEDRYSYLAPGSDVHFRYTDLTFGAEAYTSEAWVALGISTNDEAWIPRIVTRRRSDADDLASTFVAVTEPYEGKSAIKEIRRIPLGDDMHAAVEVELADGRRDLLISSDGRAMLSRQDWQTDAELAMVRRGPNGRIEKVVVCQGSFLKVGDVEVKLQGKPDSVEIAFEGEKASNVWGSKGSIADILVKGESVWNK